MKSKKPYKEVSLIRKKRNKKIKISIIFISIFLVFFIILFIILNASKVFQKNEICKTYYYLYVYTDAQNASAAEEIANNYRVRGGAGLTNFIDDRWSVLLSLYLNKKDAENVAKQLFSQNIQAQIGTISTNNISLKNLNEKEQKIGKNIYKHYLQTIETLYSFSTALDASEMTESSAQVRINQLFLLWMQRTQQLSNSINLLDNKNTKNPLLPFYNLSLRVSGLLQFLSDETNYSTNLLTYTSLTRKITLQLALITL